MEGESIKLESRIRFPSSSSTLIPNSVKSVKKSLSSGELDRDDDKCKEPLSNSGSTFNFPSQFASESSFDLFGIPSPSESPLLGSEQLEKYLNPERRAIIQVTTWNMGTLPLPKEHHLKKLFCYVGDDLLRRIDIHVIAIQESWPEIEAWEVELQMCLGPGFVLYHSLSFGTLHLSLFFRRDLVWFTSEPQETTLKVRSARLFKTKGCTGISFNLFGSRLLFVNAHLSAGEEEERCQQRLEELGKIILASQKSPHQFDAMFLSGDLNFRLNGMKKDVILHNLGKNNIPLLYENDQLQLAMSNEDKRPKFLAEFKEAAPVMFRPTYKYDIGKDSFDSSNKKRAPAFTDRIIYKCKTPSIVKTLAYEAVMNLRLSDHRPVYGIFSVEIKSGFDSLPLSGGKFKRDIFVKGIQKRAKYLLERRKKLASTVCCVS